MNRANPGQPIAIRRYCLAGLLLFLVSIGGGAPLPDSADASNGIVAEAMKVARQQQERLPAYSVLRRYTLWNKHLSAPVAVQVRWKYSPGEGREFKIVDPGTATGIAREALLKLLQQEADSSKLASDPSSVTPDHYLFESTAADESAYTIRLTPKISTKYLVNGYAYISREGGSLTRVQGTTSKRISFWVGKATISQEFANFEGYWLPSRTHSTADVRLIGNTELTIEGTDYVFGIQ